MSATVYPLDPTELTVETAQAREAAQPYAKAYQSAEPYHHICIDNFLNPEILENVRTDIAQLPDAEAAFDRAQEKLKTSYNPERLPQYTRNLFHAFNARPFILFLEEMTGIKGLIPDPYFTGAGIHRVANGGHLDIHADFNLHKQMNLERRLNVLIYLNHDWKEEYGGSFEIWDKEMAGKVKSFVPTFNRMCCFSTGSDTFHGNPETVNHPKGEHRMSIALYYYTATWDASRKSHTTLFKPRPGTVDQTDHLIARRALIKDILPPALYRKVAGKLNRLGF
ncbi:2OG-Fe(II) oxygenase [Roseobacter litoralis]|uniref:2OG-Fe(II) oxygenase n=1 Tax=Roseobacter litoralis TaxID=42443 RepID=UPI0024903CFC|nr:2OG-Fe(II) oxygenase [Roseobacter litoralis]